MQAPPLSLYIHIPWCVKKCPYCDFNSHVAEAIDEKKYLDALMVDLENDLQIIDSRPIQSIFFGGGTPSLFSPDILYQIIEGTKKRIAFDTRIEITMEANPGTFEQKNFSEFRAAGINRLSIGIQSFNAQLLKNIGRIHDDHQARSAIDTAHHAGFDNINIDLMFGLPEQGIEQATDDIKIACAQGVQHISHYQMTIEPNTFFHKHPPVTPDMEELWEMQNRCHQILSDNGFAQYEVSAFSKPGRQCRHNLNYWHFGDYIGIGAGAHGKLTSSTTGKILRRWKHRQPDDYMKNALSNPVSGEAEVGGGELVFEFLMNALRLKNGFSFETFEASTGLDRGILFEACKAVDAELLIQDEAGIRTSETGYRFLNNVLEYFL